MITCARHLRTAAVGGRIRRVRAAGFTLLDVLLTLLILAIATAISLDAIANTEAGFRADRAARETITALRYARTLAMTTGNASGVEFDTTQKKIKVYTVINGTQTWVTNPVIGTSGNLYQIDLVNSAEVAGVGMSVNIPTDTTNPYDCLFNQLGATTNVGTATFTFGQGTRTVTITALADPTLN